MLRRKPWPALARPRWTLWALVRHFAFAWMGSFGPRPSSDHSPNLPFGHCTSTAGQRSRGPAQGLEVSGPEAAKRSGGRAVACEAAAPQKSRQGLISAFGQIPGLLDSGSRALLVPLPPPLVTCCPCSFPVSILLWFPCCFCVFLSTQSVIVNLARLPLLVGKTEEEVSLVASSAVIELDASITASMTASITEEPMVEEEEKLKLKGQFGF